MTTNEVTTQEQPSAMRKTIPMIPVGHPHYKWTSGADVQATWHKYTGWTPPSGRWIRPAEQEPVVRDTPVWVRLVR
jgi:hypothetical protein